LKLGIKNYCIEVPLNDITSISNFTKNILSGSKVISAGHRQTGYLISLLSFLESRLKIVSDAITGLSSKCGALGGEMTDF
jgi:hypothetical protein